MRNMSDHTESTMLTSSLAKLIAQKMLATSSKAAPVQRYAVTSSTVPLLLRRDAQA